jgi:ABC-type nitrate/sulfonate/bicarbonate transport system substrate-binding protein
LAQERPEAVAALVRATARAIVLMKGQPERAAGIIAGVTGVPVRRELKVMQSLSWGLRLDETVRDSLEQTSAFLLKEGKISQAPDLKAAFDDRFIKR